jgi:hypothetical protein
MSAPAPSRRQSRAPQDHKPKARKPLAGQTAKIAQSAAEGAAPPDDTVGFRGKEYKISDSVSLFALMRFARAAESGISVMDFRALAALHAFLQDCFSPEDWGRFQEDMIETRENSVEELLDVATKVVEKLTSRPTPPPSASSNGQSASSAGSTDGSSSTEGGE